MQIKIISRSKFWQVCFNKKNAIVNKKLKIFLNDLNEVAKFYLMILLYV